MTEPYDSIPVPGCCYIKGSCPVGKRDERYCHKPTPCAYHAAHFRPEECEADKIKDEVHSTSRKENENDRQEG